MSDPVLPALSVLIFTPDNYETIRETMRHLQRQTVRDRLEIIILAPSRATLGLEPSELEPFFQGRVVEVGQGQAIAAARIEGVRQASALLIVLAEDHSYPEPEWAAALIAAHQEGWAAVGPVMVNANPDRRMSWADLFLGFAPWVEPAAGGPAEGLPWHNTSYRRDLLLSYGASLGELLEVESLLQSDLRARGYSLYLSASARTRHLNVTRLFSYLAIQFYGARTFAGGRAQYGEWPGPRRLCYVLGAPLIPLVRARQVLREIRRCGRQAELLPGIIPVLALGLAVCGLGEMLGYALGAGSAPRKKAELESHRERHVLPRRRHARGAE